MTNSQLLGSSWIYLGNFSVYKKKEKHKMFLVSFKKKKKGERWTSRPSRLSRFSSAQPEPFSSHRLSTEKSPKKNTYFFFLFFYLLKEYLEVSRSRNNHTVKAFYFISFYYFSFRVPENVLLTFVPLFDWNVTFSLFFLFLYRSITDMDDSKKPETNKTVKRKYEIPEVTEAETGRRTSSQIELRKRINKAMLNL